jgi:hypothetical protein
MLTHTGRAAVAACLAVPFVVTVLAAAPAAAHDSQCATPGTSTTADPWVQRMLAPDNVWPLTTGTGQRVAVLDSGVDASAPQLHGHVAAGYDAVSAAGQADTDCLGTGTHVAGAVAAARSSSGIYGVAPDATIVPVRVIGEPGANMSATPTSAVLARGIRWAAGHDVDVIDISVWLTKDDPAVREAVADAIASGVTVVAAAGDLGGADDGNPTTYPAAYAGVIDVAAVDAAGVPWDSSEHGSDVDLAAPGVGVPVLARDHGLVTVEGSTALAAGFVSGTAALVRARWSKLNPSQIADRLFDTASPTPALSGDGHGLVNVRQAVTAGLVSKPPAVVPKLRVAALSQTRLAAAAAARHRRTLAIEWTALALGALIVVMLLAIGVPRARRRAWRPTYAPAPAERPEPIEPLPVAMLFEGP